MTKTSSASFAAAAAALCAVSLLAACATAPRPPAATVGRTSVDATIASAIDRSSRVNRAIAEIEAAASAPSAPAPAQTVPDGMELPEELNRLFSVEWRGPLEPLLEGMAKEIGYKFVRTGSAPASPVMVSVYRTDEPIWRVIRDAGTLVTSEAAVVLNPRERTIEVRYAQRRKG